MENGEAPTHQLPFGDMDKFKKRLLRTKTIISQSSVDEENPSEEGGALKKVLTTFDLTSLGVGSCCGTGMYVVAGLVAKNVAGPSVILSFLFAALASVFSGVCYAEFGVRVPKTSGSAYMYSYVTVGEFVAFLIGWNLILEYMIGSAAGASALSACFDALTNHTISAYMEENLGTVIGKTYPDFLGFFIGLIMTVILAAGVQKSVRFNNILNAINFLIWVFIMIAGIVYMNGENWTTEGFAPWGASGVFSGAATCFYAFIGFDIIATTGEEAKNPSRSIPKAIVSSLIICLLAYISVSLVLTLIIPYNEIHGDSALVDMFPQAGFAAGKYIVAIGAVCALTVSLLGSMFPMPRVIYAMSRDGLLFGFLSNIYEKTGTPLLATIITGLLASLMSLLVGLKILVEMMSIGTLLAYTLVSMSVLILRYQPTKEDLEVPIPMAHRLDIIDESPEGGEQDDVFDKEPITKRRIKDDAHLLPSAGSNEPKSYGSLPVNSELLDSKWAMVKRYGKIYWLRMGFPGDECIPNPGTARMAIIFSGVLVICSIAFGMVVVFGNDSLAQGDIWAYLLALLSLIAVCACLVVIMRQPQNKKKLAFMVPGVPLVPALGLLFNVYLMLKLPALTWARLGVWILIGLALYFGYSMSHSAKERKQKRKEETAADEADTAPQTIMEDAITQLPEDEKVTFEKLPDNIPNGTRLPPGGPPPNSQPNGSHYIPRASSDDNHDTKLTREGQMSRHKSGSVRFGKTQPAEEEREQHERKPLSNAYQNSEESEVDQNYSMQKGTESYGRNNQLRNRSPPESDLYRQSEAYQKPTDRHSKNYSSSSLKDEGDPFVVDERAVQRALKKGPDSSIARPRPRPQRQQHNPFSIDDPDDVPGPPGNPFRDSIW